MTRPTVMLFSALLHGFRRLWWNLLKIALIAIQGARSSWQADPKSRSRDGAKIDPKDVRNSTSAALPFARGCKAVRRTARKPGRAGTHRTPRRANSSGILIPLIRGAPEGQGLISSQELRAPGVCSAIRMWTPLAPGVRIAYNPLPGFPGRAPAQVVDPFR